MDGRLQEILLQHDELQQPRLWECHRAEESKKKTWLQVVSVVRRQCLSKFASFLIEIDLDLFTVFNENKSQISLNIHKKSFLVKYKHKSVNYSGTSAGF